MLVCKRISVALTAALTVAFATASLAYAETFSAKVVSVVDGDTINVIGPSGSRERVILYGIDCPEPTQDFGQNAKQFTDLACFRKDVTIRCKKAKISMDGLSPNVILAVGSNLNEALVTNGLAWWSDKLCTERNFAQANARYR